jgi:hypothetical protein
LRENVALEKYIDRKNYWKKNLLTILLWFFC